MDCSTETLFTERIESTGVWFTSSSFGTNAKLSVCVGQSVFVCVCLCVRPCTELVHGVDGKRSFENSASANTTNTRTRARFKRV